jgi:cysteinyl-tRNA synthetase
MHVGFVMVNGAKMAKSAGNLVFVHDLLERWPAGAVRLLILSRRWGDSWEFDEPALEKAAAELERLWHYDAKAGGSEAAAEQVRAALLDDLDVPRALDIAREAGGQVQRDLVSLLGLGAGEPGHGGAGRD